jgi:ATP-dependent Clp protease ATP-binding subunit ClpA
VQVFAQTNVQTSVSVSALAKYTTDLTGLALNGRLRVNDSYQNETARLMKTLSGGELRQTVILDETSENQELVVEQMAIRAAKEFPAKRILKLEVGAIYSNAKSDAEVAAITNSIFSELAQKSDTILFVDELTNFIGRSNVGASLNNLLLQGKVRIIGGSSKVAYKENIEPVAEVDALFEKITVGDNANSSDELNNKTAKYDGYKGDNVSPRHPLHCPRTPISNTSKSRQSNCCKLCVPASPTRCRRSSSSIQNPSPSPACVMRSW